jgi:hypothetical protein
MYMSRDIQQLNVPNFRPIAPLQKKVFCLTAPFYQINKRKEKKMKCAECNLWWADDSGIPCSCHADPNWPAPCEYDDYEEDE